MNKKLKIIFGAFILLVSCTKSKEVTLMSASNVKTNASTTGAASVGSYRWDFDEENPLHDLDFANSSASDIQVVNDPNDPNNKVLKTVLVLGNDRTECSLFNSNLTNLMYYYADAQIGFEDKAGTMPNSRSLGSEVWISTRILKPQEQNTGGLKPCIFQFGPVSNNTLIPSQESMGLCQLRIRNGTTSVGDRWNWRLFDNNVYTPQKINTNIDNSFVSPNYGVWENFVMHVKYRTDSDGLIEVWKDGVKYINITGANAYSFNRARIKWGIYIGIGNQVKQELNCYFDDIKIVSGASTYDEMKYVNQTSAVTADTYTYGGSPTVSYGSSFVLNVKNDVLNTNNTYKRITYLKFDLTNLNFSPYTAKLILTTESNTGGGTIKVNACSQSAGSASWIETGLNSLTWSNQSSYLTVTDSITSQSIDVDTSKVYVLNITNYLRQQYSLGKTETTLALTGGNNLFVFRSKEYSQNTYSKPQLSINK